MARGDRQAAVKVDGLTEFRKDLKEFDNDLRKQLQVELRGIARKVAAMSASSAPRGETGQLAASYNGKATAGLRATVTNSQFYGRFVEFGHKTRDGGFVEGQYVVGRILEREEDRIVDEVGDAFDRAARQAGWRT